MSRLVATALTVTLSGRQVLLDVSLSLAPGEIVGLIGPNGAGKSTLMRAVVGQAETDGTVELDGRDLAALSSGERARLVAYLPQNRIIGWPVSVRRVVGLGRMPWRRFGAAADARDADLVERAMAAMDVGHLADRPATQLSGGEQARVAAARAIAQDTPVLVADEPASGLDPAHQMTMMAALRRLAGEGRSVLVSLHDLTLAARWCDRLVVIAGGRIAAHGAPASVLTPELLAEAFGIVARLETDAGGLLLTPTGLSVEPHPR